MQSNLLVLNRNGSTLAAIESTEAAPELILAHGRVGSYPKDALPDAAAMDTDRFLTDLRGLGSEIKAQLVGLDDAVDILLLGLLSGLNIFLLSLPGAAKSTLARMLAQGIARADGGVNGVGLGGRFFQRVMNPDLSRNDIFGMIDPLAMQAGEWRRKWDGVAAAGCHLALFDEFYKSSGQVRAMVLEVLEEHHVTEGVHTRPLDLLLGIAASNELVDPSPKNADWDRFGIRYQIRYPARASEWRKLFTAASGRIPITTRLDPREILLLQAWIEVLARKIRKPVADAAAKVLAELHDKELGVSPRRVQAWLRAATAAALLEGGAEAEVEPRHLAVGEDILWITPESRAMVGEVVSGISDPERGRLLKIRAAYEELLGKHKQAKSMQDATLVVGRCVSLVKSLEEGKGKATDELRERIARLKDEAAEKGSQLGVA